MLLRLHIVKDGERISTRDLDLPPVKDGYLCIGDEPIAECDDAGEWRSLTDSYPFESEAGDGRR